MYKQTIKQTKYHNERNVVVMAMASPGYGRTRIRATANVRERETETEKIDASKARTGRALLDLSEVQALLLEKVGNLVKF